jgi:hypothetical protein
MGADRATGVPRALASSALRKTSPALPGVMLIEKPARKIANDSALGTGSNGAPSTRVALAPMSSRRR